METKAIQSLEVEAQSLQEGDYLTATKCTVVCVYRKGLKIPSGKVEVVFYRPGQGQAFGAMWGAHTKISVERAS